MRDENCACNHGGADQEDHTPDNGCEQRGCTCRYWPITFENVNNKVEITKGYSVTGAPAMEYKTPRGVKKLVPYAARFVFTDGDLGHLHLGGKVVRQDGRISDQVQQVPNIYSWNQQEWPAWLHDLYKIACDDLVRESLNSA